MIKKEKESPSVFERLIDSHASVRGITSRLGYSLCAHRGTNQSHNNSEVERSVFHRFGWIVGNRVGGVLWRTVNGLCETQRPASSSGLLIESDFSLVSEWTMTFK